MEDYTFETAAAAIADGSETIESIAAVTGWPIVDDCLVPEPTQWHADDGNAETIEEHDSAQDAAQSYVDGGDWGEERPTFWVRVNVWRQGIDADGDMACVDEERIKITVEPEEPDCADGRDHDWQSPIELVGGCSENPGVYGSGGGVKITEVCVICGCGKTTDTWAQDPNDGEQGLDSTSYAPAKYADEISEYLEKQVEFLVQDSTDEGQAFVLATLPDFCATYVVAAEEADDEGYNYADSDEWPAPTGGWPRPPASLIDEARKLAAT